MTLTRSGGEVRDPCRGKRPIRGYAGTAPVNPGGSRLTGVSVPNPEARHS